MKGKLTYTKADFADGAHAPEAKKGADAAFTAWAAGTSLKALVVQYGGSRSSMRKRLTTGAGGKAQFRALRAQGAGGTSIPFGGKRAQGGRTVEQRVADDSAVKQITKSTGWRTERRYKGILVSIHDVGNMAWREEIAHIYVSPKGNKYVQAKPSQKADLIRSFSALGLPSMRLVRYAPETVERKVKAEARVVERGQASLARKRAAKRAARQARQARRHK